jgi:hypothetical protein
MASLKRDADMEKIATELREKRGTESLMERHTKKLKKEKDEDARPKERRPFDRDVDLQVVILRGIYMKRQILMSRRVASK